jgi:8-oxo-dGTP pyrophosphatase MutT (NUDIX family)
MSEDQSEKVPIPSATTVVLRDSDRGPKILMIKRRRGNVFGENYAFPGGLVDADDSRVHQFCSGVTAHDANKLLHVSAGGLDYYSAAVRELFEETGVLLARDEKGHWPTQDRQLRAQRIATDLGQLAWSDFLQDRTLKITCDHLYYFAHWEPPPGWPKRWSTRFFLVEMPTGQEARHGTSEHTDSRWLTANEALLSSQDGSIEIPYPTARILESLRDFESVDSLQEWAQSKSRKGIPLIVSDF